MHLRHRVFESNNSLRTEPERSESVGKTSKYIKNAEKEVLEMAAYISICFTGLYIELQRECPRFQTTPRQVPGSDESQNITSSDV